MMPNEPLRDVMRRTMKNLEFVERSATPTGPFEVTQLINSFIGALAHPWEGSSTVIPTATSISCFRGPTASQTSKPWPENDAYIQLASWSNCFAMRSRTVILILCLARKVTSQP